MKKAYILAMAVFLVFSILSGTAYALSGGDIVGTWRLASITQDNIILTPEEAGIHATIVINAENKAVMISSGSEPLFASWRIMGESVFFNDGSEEYRFNLVEGRLIATDLDSIQMAFEKINDGTEIDTDSPAKTDAVIGDFMGAWSAVYIEIQGVVARLADLGAEMTVSITGSTLVSHESYGEEEAVNNATCAMDGYHLKIFNEDGTTQLLTLHENGMISIPTNQNTIWLKNDAVTETPPAGKWTCDECGHEENTGKFCTECGASKPQTVEPGGWTCSCGTENEGKFCTECGSPKPDDTPVLSECRNCGWQFEDPNKPPKYCPECGDASYY